jgi:mono/diheme cytochrome c family protein
MKHISLKNWMAWGLCLVALTGCHWDLWDQERYEPLEHGDNWGEGESSSRELIEGTVPYQGARLDTAYYKGMDANDDFITALPAQITLSRELLKRGQARFNIYCAPCHGEQGLGDGMIISRGFPTPPSYSDQRLLEVPIGYFYDVMTNGFGRMYSYKSRIPVEDRWAIAAYIRVLQLSQNGTQLNLSEELLELATNPPLPDAGAHAGGHEVAGENAEGHSTDQSEQEEEGNGEH